jgi:hypothetical protein
MQELRDILVSLDLFDVATEEPLGEADKEWTDRDQMARNLIMNAANKTIKAQLKVCSKVSEMWSLLSMGVDHDWFSTCQGTPVFIGPEMGVDHDWCSTDQGSLASIKLGFPPYFTNPTRIYDTAVLALHPTADNQCQSPEGESEMKDPKGASVQEDPEGESGSKSSHYARHIRR